MSASLATLAPDCIAELIQHLYGDDFISLMMTGDRSLRHKLVNNCFGLFFEPAQATKFPFAAFKLPKLRSLVAYMTENIAAYMDFRNGGELALIQGSKTLEKLDLRFRNSAALFLTPGVSLPRLLVRDRFPSLTTLKILDFVCEGSLEGLFGELPDSLTTFSIKRNNIDDEEPPVSLLSIAHLPRHLQTLEIQGYTLEEPVRRAFKFEANLLPPNLAHLTLETLSGTRILDALPSTLKTLRFKLADPYYVSPHWKISKLPFGLVSLWTNLPSQSLDVDAPLPQTLEKLESPFNCFQNDKITIDHLPKGLKLVPRLIFFQKTGQEAELIIKKLPNIEYAQISDESTVPLLPGGLKTLICEKPIFIDSALPQGLTSLNLRKPIPTANLKNIPSSLTFLNVGSPSHLRETRAEEGHGQFPAWLRSDFLLIAERIRLVSLEIEYRYIGSGVSLAPLAKVETLKNFALDLVPLESFFDAPTWLPKCLPVNLHGLHLSVGDPSSSLGKEIRKEIFSPIFDLKEVTPNLKSLRLHSSYPSPIALTPEFFASLPRGMLKLILNLRSAELKLNALSQLPRPLQCLSLHFFEMDPLNGLSNDHFRVLPPHLVELFVQIYWSKNSVTAKLFDMLPKSIASISFIDEPQFLARQRDFLDSNPITKGFRPIVRV